MRIFFPSKSGRKALKSFLPSEIITSYFFDALTVCLIIVYLIEKCRVLVQSAVLQAFTTDLAAAIISLSTAGVTDSAPSERASSGER